MFTFNGVFGENATQAEVFKPVEKLIESALIGYKVTIFAFGQTGSGKTYTMSGGPDKKDGGTILTISGNNMQIFDLNFALLVIFSN